MKTSQASERGSKTPVLKEDEFVLIRQKGKQSFSPNEIIHFKNTLFHQDEPYGNSMLEITLRSFHHLRLLRRVPPHVQSQFQDWKRMLEGDVYAGLGVPRFVLERHPAGWDTQIAELILITFVAKIRRSQELLSEGFDRAIGIFAGQAKLKEVPRIELKRLTERMVLLDCGFSYAREIESWKAFHDAGIITKEELDAKLKEFEL